MKIGLVKRLEKLEELPPEKPKIHLCWYGDPEPSNPNAIRIQIKWYDEVKDETKYDS